MQSFLYCTYVCFCESNCTIIMQEASDALSKTADSDTVSTYQVSSVQLVTNNCIMLLMIGPAFGFMSVSTYWHIHYNY